MELDRHSKLAFKQIVRKEWMDRTLDLVVAGLSEKEIRSYLDEYISTQQQKGGEGPKRNKATYGMSTIMLACWFRKDPELEDFRSSLVGIARITDKSSWLPLHMAMLNAAYPFWYQVCSIVGKLFSLQDTISSAQIYDRVKDIYGDRETVARNTRYAIRTMVSWGFIQDFPKRKGWYIKGKTVVVYNLETVAKLLESIVWAEAEGRIGIDSLNRSIGLFGFGYDYMSAGMLKDLSKGRLSTSEYDRSNTIVFLN